MLLTSAIFAFISTPLLGGGQSSAPGAPLLRKVSAEKCADFFQGSWEYVAEERFEGEPFKSLGNRVLFRSCAFEIEIRGDNYSFSSPRPKLCPVDWYGNIIHYFSCASASHHDTQEIYSREVNTVVMEVSQADSGMKVICVYRSGSADWLSVTEFGNLTQSFTSVDAARAAVMNSCPKTAQDAKALYTEAPKREHGMEVYYFNYFLSRP